jgi:hypothetical protein
MEQQVQQPQLKQQVLVLEQVLEQVLVLEQQRQP